MAEVIRMPKMSDTMQEGVIAQWLVKVGDEVQAGDILAEVETDKATMELENYEDGVILYIGPKEKDSVPVDGIIAVLGEEGEDYEDLLKEEGGNGKDSSKPEEKAPAAETTETAPDSGGAEEVDTSDIPAEVIAMPKMSDTMQEGLISSWLVKVGDTVASGDVLAEVETDKATMELENYTDGTILYLAVEAGNSVPVDGVIAVIGEEGANYEPLIKKHQQGNKEEAPKEESKPKEEKPAQKAPEQAAADKQPAPAAQPATTATATAEGRIKASPLAKKLAAEKGYDIAQIPGSGENGRIVKRDVEAYQPAAAPAQQPAAAATNGQDKSNAINFVQPVALGEESHTDEGITQMRKTIARRLSESKFGAPHFYLTMEINMDKAVEARKGLNELSPVKISFNDLVIKAAAAALRQHPQVNASWLGDKVRTYQHIHVGVAVAVSEGLLVPVIRHADQKSLSQISAEVKDLGKKAKEKKLQPSDWEGNTFTVSNLGMFGIEEFTAIINPPDSCIMAVGGIKQTPIVKDGEIKIGNVMKVTLSCDHRIVDGAVGAAFLKTFKQLLEDPVRILI